MLKKILTSTQNLRKTQPLFFYLSLLVLIISFYLKAEPGIFNLTHFSFDQGEDIILTKNLVVDHDISLISRGSGLQGVFMGPGYTWFLAIPFFLSGGSPNFNNIYLALLSTLTTIITYIIVNRLTDPTAALLAAFYAALSPSFVGVAKIVLSPTPLIFLAIIYIWLIYLISIKKQDKLLIPLSFLISIFFHFEIAYALFALTAAIITIAIYRRLQPFLIRPALVSLLAFIIPFAPQVLFDLRHQFLISNSLLQFFTGQNQSLGSSNLTLLERIPDRFHSFTEDLIGSLSFNPHSWILTTIAIGFFCYGWLLIIQFKNRRYQKIGAVTFLLLVFTYLGFVIYPGPLWPWYRTAMPAFFTLLSALAIAQIVHSAPRPVKPIPIAFLFISAIITINLSDRLQIIQADYQGSISTVKNQHLVLDSIYTNAAAQPFALYLYTPPVYPNIWDYELYWYAQPKYGYLPQPYDVMPQKNNPNTIYLLVETDVEYPIWIDGWRDNFTHYGDMVDSWDFDFGARVEKWQFHSEPDNPNPLIREVNLWPS